MQWNSNLNAGFSDGKNGTWLDVGPNFTTINVEVGVSKPHNNQDVFYFSTLILIHFTSYYSLDEFKFFYVL